MHDVNNSYHAMNEVDILSEVTYQSENPHLFIIGLVRLGALFSLREKGVLSPLHYCQEEEAHARKEV